MLACNRSNDINSLDRQRARFEQIQALMRQGDMPAALQHCRASLNEFPQDANLMCLASRTSLATRDFTAARQYAENAIRAYPQFATAHDALGDVLLVEGEPGLALESYQRALEQGGNGQTLARKMQRARQSMELTANSPMPQRSMPFAAEIAQAQEFEQAGDRNEAEEIYRRILTADPDHVEACRLMGGIASYHEEYEDAKVFLQRALKLAPDYLRAMVDLANVHRQLEEFEPAFALAQQLVALAPDNSEAYMVYASVAGVAGHHVEAIEAYENALAINPGKAAALCGMAHHLKTIGRHDEAVARYRQSIAIRPDFCEAYWSLANLKTFRFEAHEVAAMQQLLQRDDLPDEGRAQLHNALGLEFEARRDYASAWRHFSECNAVRRKSEFYDPIDTEDTHDRVIAMFTAEFLEQPASEPHYPVPIFVVGLPRSGSTLIEQILASHSRVDGTHELSDLSKVIRNLRKRQGQGQGRGRMPRFPEVLEGLRQRDWEQLGTEYLERSAKHRGQAPYFIDKNPNNFVFAGLIRLALPHARIINARRHPLDSCLGSFKQLFASGQPFSYDATELAEYYLQYQRLMDHWHGVMPGFVLDVNYEDVVNDLETQVRRMLDFCGLPFEEACLRFHETERAVKTASSEQVRRPIYSSSVHLWRRYEPYLGTFQEILEPLLDKLPVDQQPA